MLYSNRLSTYLSLCLLHVRFHNAPSSIILLPPFSNAGWPPSLALSQIVVVIPVCIFCSG